MPLFTSSRFTPFSNAPTWRPGRQKDKTRSHGCSSAAAVAQLPSRVEEGVVIVGLLIAV